MSTGPTGVPKFRAGRTISARALNNLRDVASAGQVLPFPGALDVLDGRAAIIFEAEITALATSAPWRLTCIVKGDAGLETFDVIAPLTFYEAGRGSVTYSYVNQNERTATGPGGTETQRLTPDYIVGDSLFCIRWDDAALDLNIDGRQWAAEASP